MFKHLDNYADDLYIIGAVSCDEKVTSSLYVCNRAERRRREARREMFKTPELVTTRRSILGLVMIRMTIIYQESLTPMPVRQTSLPLLPEDFIALMT